jgi:hypothetical protein
MRRSTAQPHEFGRARAGTVESLAMMSSSVASVVDSRGESRESHRRFLPEKERAEALRRAGACGALTISVSFAGPAVPLAETVDEQIERELAIRGAAGGPRLGDAASRLGNQIHRMRQVGAALLCLSFENLAVQKRGDGGLTPEDAEALRFWIRAAETRPVELFLDPSDAELPAAPSSPAPPPAVIEKAPAPEVVAAPDVHVAPVAPVTVEAPTDERWRRWMLELYAARGPQSLASFERLFTRSYMPLVQAIDAGLEAPKAAQVAEEFRRTFARMYAEACPTFALTGKRPRMVLDAWDAAGRLARLHGARSTHLLLVDGMRWDLGEEIKRLVLLTLDARAQLADEQILWSAVPTTTPRQLATLAHGVDALRGEADVPVDGEGEPLRGRTAEMVRRVKVGARDLYKLDLVEARLGQVPLPELAAHAATCITRHVAIVAPLAPRTLLFVFGDHGFHRSPNGTFSHGGTTPEEVLVPSFALVVGALH